MPGTLITPSQVVTDGRSAGDGYWLSAAGLSAALGWELKREGFCRDDICVPVPPGRESSFVMGSEVNAVALARELGQPIVRDDMHDLWAVGESAEIRRSRLSSLEAPDFSLPDMEGNVHSLSDYRGRKVYLATWASW